MMISQGGVADKEGVTINSQGEVDENGRRSIDKRNDSGNNSNGAKSCDGYDNGGDKKDSKQSQTQNCSPLGMAVDNKDNDDGDHNED